MATESYEKRREIYLTAHHDEAAKKNAELPLKRQADETAMAGLKSVNERSGFVRARPAKAH